MSCGIYKLIWDSGRYFYIGRSKNIEVRYINHLTAIKSGTHTKQIQKICSLYGDPEYRIVCECTPDKLIESEQHYLFIYDKDCGLLNRNRLSRIKEEGDTRTLTLRAKIGQEWVLAQLEKIAKDKKRSVNFIALEILEKHVKKTKKD